jgi:hypothetical protein
LKVNFDFLFVKLISVPLNFYFLLILFKNGLKFISILQLSLKILLILFYNEFSLFLTHSIKHSFHPKSHSIFILLHQVKLQVFFYFLLKPYFLLSNNSPNLKYSKLYYFPSIYHKNHSIIPNFITIIINLNSNFNFDFDFDFNFIVSLNSIMNETIKIIYFNSIQTKYFIKFLHHPKFLKLYWKINYFNSITIKISTIFYYSN